MNKLIIGFILILISPKIIAQADIQQKRHINRQAAGFIIQHGFNYYKLPEGHAYRPVLLASYLNFPLFHTKGIFNLAVGLVPQVGFANTNKVNLEFGVNVYLSANLAFSERDLFSLIAGAGPHYVNVDTKRQASGFIFSDNFLLAYRRAFNINQRPFEFSLYGGFRHISNASLQKPNKGIDNIITGIGFAKLF